MHGEVEFCRGDERVGANDEGANETTEGEACSAAEQVADVSSRYFDDELRDRVDGAGESDELESESFVMKDEYRDREKESRCVRQSEEIVPREHTTEGTEPTVTKHICGMGWLVDYLSRQRIFVIYLLVLFWVARGRASKFTGRYFATNQTFRSISTEAVFGTPRMNFAREESKITNSAAKRVPQIMTGPLRKSVEYGSADTQCLIHCDHTTN